MRTVWIFGDQLSLVHSGLEAARARGENRVLMIESKARGAHIRYHQQKLVLIYSGMRHFAAELRKEGWEVDYHRLEDTPTFEAGMRRHLAKYEPETLVLAEPNDFLMTDAAERAGRKFKVPVEFVATRQFLVPRAEFAAWAGDQQRLVMENHYRRVRKATGYLMGAKGKPVGERWNFDVENRKTHRDWVRAGKPRAPEFREEPDDLTREVIAVVQSEFPGHHGDAAQFWYPVDRAGALRWLKRFIQERLAEFGPYEDIMASDEPYFFHSVLSPALNLGLLTPQECVEAALVALEKGLVPLASVEGFVRQIIGWREFINGIYWHRGPEYKSLNALDADRPLPAWLWTGETSMNCLHHAVKQALEIGWNNHIQRLMVLGNFLLLTGVRPPEALHWYLEMTVDAYDWVMAANVIGMVLHADGGYMATKPYAATSAYINKMSDYCKGCRYRPDVRTGPDACPYNYLYWNFMDRHSARFAGNHRMRPIIHSWLARPEASKEEVRKSAAAFLAEHVPA